MRKIIFLYLTLFLYSNSTIGFSSSDEGWDLLSVDETWEIIGGDLSQTAVQSSQCASGFISERDEHSDSESENADILCESRASTTESEEVAGGLYHQIFSKINPSIVLNVEAMRPLLQSSDFDANYDFRQLSSNHFPREIKAINLVLVNSKTPVDHKVQLLNILIAKGAELGNTQSVDQLTPLEIIVKSDLEPHPSILKALYPRSSSEQIAQMILKLPSGRVPRENKIKACEALGIMMIQFAPGSPIIPIRRYFS